MVSRLKRSPALMVVIGVVVVAVIAFGWWTISPLFIKTTLVEGQNIPVAAAMPSAAMTEAPKPDNTIVEAAKPSDAMAEASEPDSSMQSTAVPSDTMPEATATNPGETMAEAAKPGDSMAKAEADKPEDAMKVEAATGPVVLGIGNFDRQDDFHYATGQAIIARQEDGSHILRLQDLDAANGPDLYVYLTEHPNPSNSDELHQGDHNLGLLKATNGSFSYALDPSVDVSKVKSVVIYCRAFTVIFSVATLQAEQ